jgi:bacteriorhodopsin
MSDLRPILTPINMIVSVGMYYPLFKKILARRSTADYSITTQALITALQASSLLVAASEHAWYLFYYYIVGCILTSTTLLLVWKYRAGSAQPARLAAPSTRD